MMYNERILMATLIIVGTLIYLWVFYPILSKGGDKNSC